MNKIFISILLFLMFCSDGFAQSVSYHGLARKIRYGTTLPATCTTADAFMDTDATSGQRFYLCESANTWTLQGDGGAGGSGDPILIDGVAVTDASGVDLIGGTTGIDITFSAVASPDTATFGIDLTEITCGAGLVCASATSIATDSTEAAFLASGALVCGAGTAGKVQVHTTPLQYCDNAATPVLQYAAYGSSAGVATSTTSDSTWTSHNSYPAGCAASNWVTTIGDTNTCSQPAFTDISGAVTDAQVPNTITVDLATLATTATTANAGDSATSFFSTGTLEVAIGGTGTTTSTGTGAVVLGTSPTIATPALTLQDGNAAAPTTDGVIKYDRTAEVLQVGDGTITRSFPSSKVIAGFSITNGNTAIDATVTDPVACQRINNNSVITGWYIDCDASGSIVLDVWKNTWDDTPEVNADSIAGTEKPTLSTDVSASDTALGSMTTDWNSGQNVCIEIESAATVTKCSVQFVGYND